MIYIIARTADPSDSHKITENSRYIGLMVGRGTAITVVASEDG
jgi:hypothetical protein